MRNVKLKPTLYLLLGISLVLFLTIHAIQKKQDFTLWTIASTFSKVVTADILLIGLFSSFLWKAKIFKGWLVLFPDLNGTWKGEIQSTWIDPQTEARPEPIPVILTIHQTFFKISCVMRTAEMTSHCITADFVLEEADQIKKLFYSYDSKPIPTVRDRSPQHWGTMVFDLIEKPRKLEGEYWTGRKTTGRVELTFWKKEKIEFFPKNIGAHPVSETRSNKS